VSKVISQASQPETAYVLAALDLAEPEPLWTTVLDRLRFAAAGEGSAGRARAALVYALVKSGDGTGAKAELAKLDALPRPYPLLAPLHGYVDKGAAKAVADAGAAAAAKPEGPVAAAGAAAQPPSGGPPAAAGPAPAAGGGGGGGDGMQAATQAIRKGDWERARQIYDALVARNPNDSEALCGIGDVARAQGDSAGAVAAYKRVISTNPSYLPALLGIADTQWATGDRASATKGYRDIADRFPEGSYPSYVKQRAEGPAASPVAAAPSTSASKPPAAPPRDPSAAAGE
jgi:TolA-binding protein